MSVLLRQIWGENYHWPDWTPIWVGEGDPPTQILEQFPKRDLLLVRADPSGILPNVAGINWKQLAALPIDARGIKVLEE